MRLVHRLRRFVDWDLGSSAVGAGKASLLVAMLLWVPALIAQTWANATVAKLLLPLTLLLNAAWFAFVIWRGLRLLKASALKGDRDYDRRGKYHLASEYRASESATRARRRRRE